MKMHLLHVTFFIVAIAYGYMVAGSVVRMQQEYLWDEVAKTPPPSSSAGSMTFGFASYYGSHMVLQRAPQRAQVWGYANSTLLGETLTLTLIDEEHNKIVQKLTTKVTLGDEAGKKAVWSVLLEAQKAGGPYTVKVKVSEHVLEKTDVYFGDVWLCSGQSNMQFTVHEMFDAAAEEAMADELPLIRVFTAAEKFSDKPLTDLASVEEPWSIASNKSIGHSDWSYFSAVCWVYGRYLHQFLGIPVGLVATTWGGTPVEAWSSPDALKRCDMSGVSGPSAKSVLYNAMIHPFLNLTIKGAIWYQGEANAGAPDTYNCTFPAMISDWRQKWAEGTKQQTKPDFPFGFVQLGPDAVYAKGRHVTRGYPDIRWHQTADQGYVPNTLMPNTFMASAVDLTDDKSPYGSVHIRDKKTVGQRLVLSGLSVVYGVSGLKYQGPSVTAYFIDTGFYTLRLEFDSGKEAISVQSKDSGVDVCCQKDNQTYCNDDTMVGWYTAPLVGHNANSITVSWSACKGMWVTGIRYIWRETPCMYQQCPVYSVENNLPATPFIQHGLIGGPGK